jgi:hypothetical protein
MTNNEDLVNLRENLFDLLEDFNKWLEDMSEKYGMDKDDIQALIKQFL